MVLTPLDIQKKEFRHVLRGYSEDEVNAFLDQIAQDFENMIRENQELREKIDQTEQNVARYREIEEAIKNAMVMAQKNADELRQNAEKEAKIILDRSRIEADQLAREAEREVAGLLHETEKQVSAMKAEYERVRREAYIFRVRLRSFLGSQIELLENEEKELPAEEELTEVS